MNQITKETRLESYIQRPVRRCDVILEAIAENGAMTARQLAHKLDFVDMNMVRPRLTELADAGKIKPVAKVLDMATGKSVALWDIVE